MQNLSPDRAARITTRINALLAGILTLPEFRNEQDFYPLVTEYLQRPSGPSKSYDETSQQASALYDAIETALPPTQRELIAQYSDVSGQLAWAETMAAFDVGRRSEAAIVNQRRPRPAIERVMDVLQFTVGQMEATDAAYLRGCVNQLQAAVPVAKAVILTGEAIRPAAGPLDQYLQRERERVKAQPEDPTDPDHECDVAAATENAIYFTALAVGLLLSEAL